MSKIIDIKAREILDSRGDPTVEVDVITSDGKLGRSSVPSGASIGKYEALEQRDKDPKRYQGKGVINAVSNVNRIIRNELVGKEVTDQIAIDKSLIILDGSDNKQNLGANAILGVSLALAHAGAADRNLPFYDYVRQVFSLNFSNYLIPVPMFNILNGGKHATNSTDIQEFMIVPHGFDTYKEALRAGSEIFDSLGSLLNQADFGKLVGDEGGFAQTNLSNEAAAKLLVQAIEKSGYKPGEQVSIGLDCAANEFYDYEQLKYKLKKDNKIVSSTELTDLYVSWANTLPLSSIEDPYYEDDWDGFAALSTKLGDKVKIIGDDLFATNTKRLQEGINKKSANGILVKVNQIGTLTETIETVNLAQKNGMIAIISHRSGETEDTTIADLSVAINAGYIKSGSVSRGERTSKYNQLLRIEEALGSKATFSKF